MTRLIISTVGTSLQGNAGRWDFDPGNPESLVMFLQMEPQKASAESNALSRLAKEDDELVFLHSDTPEGTQCSEALAAYFQGQGFEARSVRIAGLSYQERGFVQHGLRNFIRLLAGELRTAQRQGRATLINATGGFKAEIAYATAVGLVFHSPVSYIHEKFGDIVTLPTTPISWDYSLFTWHSDFFDWIDGGADGEARPTPAVRQRLSALPEQVALLLEDDDDGHTYLSPLGEAYLEAFRGEQETRKPLFMSEPAAEALKQATMGNQGRYYDLMERLRRREQGEKYTSTEMLQDGIYKYPKGKSVQRVFFTERDGRMYILEFCGHEDQRRYEQLMPTIRWSHYERGEFTELP